MKNEFPSPKVRIAWQAILLVSIFLGAYNAAADTLTQIKNPIPPKFGAIQRNQNGQLELSRIVARTIQDQTTKRVPVTTDSGKIDEYGRHQMNIVEKDVIETSERVITEIGIQMISPEEFVLLRDGRVVDPNTVTTRPTPVVLNESGSPLDPFYLSFLAKGVLILEMKVRALPITVPNAAGFGVPQKVTLPVSSNGQSLR